MPDSKRPNPERILRQINEQEHQEKRGKLKIYLGAAPGVGKTYSMLQDAITQRNQGLDVVVGVVKTHGRQEVQSMLQKLEVLPRQSIDYRGNQLSEFDLDAALKRQPALILIDEMAHTNAPGLRHAKRWQDIKELLDRGIDVNTTLNVQHIESLNDDVSQIIHAPIKETIPDTMLELATTIELVDLSPEDLLKRLHEGKIYIPAQANLAAEMFFRKGNLIALREVALRFTADRVGSQVLLYRQGQGIQHIWPTREKILVCVGPHPESLKLIRAAKRVASSLQIEWIAVYVHVPEMRHSEEKRNQAIQNLRLAEQLGATTRVLNGFDIVKELMNFARSQNITQIMVWKHIRTRWLDFFFKSLADEIVRHSGEIDIYIMTGETQQVTKSKPVAEVSTPIAWGGYIITCAIVITATVISYFLSPFLNAYNLGMIYFIGVIIIALFGRIGPASVGAIFSVLAYDFFFIPPLYSFAISDAQYLITVIVMLIVAIVISHLTILTRRQMEAVSLTENQTSALYTLSRQLASTRGVDKLLKTGIYYIANMFDCEVLALIPKHKELLIRAGSHRSNQTLNAKEMGVAQWVYELGQVAGLGTDTLSFSDALYVPLLGSQNAIGVLRVQPIKKARMISPEQMNLLQACVNQIALALEVDRLQETKKRSGVKTETHRIRNALLQSVSHDLSAPLVAIMGAANSQIEMADALPMKEVQRLGKEVYGEAEQLSRLLNNLLQISYLDADEIALQKQLYPLKEIIHLVLNTTNQLPNHRQINLILPDDLPLVPCDHTLMQVVFMNLIDNAIKFTPPEATITISAKVDGNDVLMTVADDGPGLLPDEVNKLFEKFYRGRKLTTERGLGLGLAISRGIIQAHGGKMWAENRKEGGALFGIRLPLGEGY